MAGPKWGPVPTPALPENFVRRKVFNPKFPTTQTTVDPIWYWTWPNSRMCPRRDHDSKLCRSVVSTVFTAIFERFLSFFRVLIWFHLCVRFFPSRRVAMALSKHFPTMCLQISCHISHFLRRDFFRALLGTLSIRLDVSSGFQDFEAAKSCDFKLVWNVSVWERVLQGLFFRFRREGKFPTLFRTCSNLFSLRNTVEFRLLTIDGDFLNFRVQQRFEHYSWSEELKVTNLT